MKLQDLLSSAMVPPMTGGSDSNIELPDDFFQLDKEEPFEEQSQDPDFQENLAEQLDETYLDELATKYIQKITDDDEARQPWMDTISKARELIGLGEDSSYEEPFPGSSSVTYPIITKAQIQFISRALPEIWPNDPVKGLVIGRSTPILEQQADRVADGMNYQITYQDKANKKEFEKMLWWLPITGSAFRYVYYDPISQMNRVCFVPVENFIAPYGTTSLATAPHYAHKIYDSKNTIKKLINVGYYRHIDLKNAPDTDIEENSAQEMRDAGDGMEKTSNVKFDMDPCYIVYADENLNGFEEVDEKGEETDIELPYRIIIHIPTQKILAIYRNWKEDDDLKLKRLWYAHYMYQKGPGFYGSGLPHLIGSIQEATNGGIRAFGDALAFSIMPSGWKSKNAKFSGTNVFSPGKFQDVDMTTDDINKEIKIASFAPPTPQMLEYIKMLSDEAQAVVSIQDIMVGQESPQNSPVGSTLAMIEQASKVVTAQHKSLWESFSEELQILFDLNYDYLPEGEEFSMPGKFGIMQRSDFSSNVGVIPTADPAVASFQQRQAIDQMCFQLYQYPSFTPYFRNNGYDLLHRMLKNSKVPALEEIFIMPEEFAKLQQQQAQNPPPPSPEEQKMQMEQAAQQQQLQLAQEKLQSDQQQAAQSIQLQQNSAIHESAVAQEKLNIERERIELDKMKIKLDNDLNKYKTDLDARNRTVIEQEKLIHQRQSDDAERTLRMEMEMLKYAMQDRQDDKNAAKEGITDGEEPEVEKDDYMKELITSIRDNLKALADYQKSPKKVMVTRDKSGNLQGEIKGE